MTCDSLHVGKKFSTQKKLNTQASRNKKTKIKIKISITKMIDLLFTGNKSEKKKKKEIMINKSANHYRHMASHKKKDTTMHITKNL